MTRPAIPIQSSISAAAPDSLAWLVDIWGVLHNGARAFPAACEACRTFRGKGGIVVLISNAPRPFTAVVPHLTSLGVPADAYDTGVTSGDVTRGLLEAWRGRRVLHIGPERDLGIFTGLGITLAAAEGAEAVVCSGFYDDTKETPADYADLFEGLLARRLPMICANPDIKVERGGELVWCAGALAADYQAKGGEVVYAGKPYLPIYQRALGIIDALAGQPVNKDGVLAIGDGLETDLRGAHAAGLPSVFIASAIHAPGGLSADVLRDLFAARPFAPVAALPALAW
ncbi:MAG: TIGR01459 family HAD-type hydrolase [Hyphomicrobiaceae bacterium]